ncbi:hypothetical protein ABZP36_013868 [Zizania latifolia]
MMGMSKACAGRASEQPLSGTKIDRHLHSLATANRFDQNGTRAERDKMVLDIKTQDEKEMVFKTVYCTNIDENGRSRRVKE